MSRADFEFYKKVLDGQQDDKPRWKKMLGLLDWAVGEALGELYVQQVTQIICPIESRFCGCFVEIRS